MPQTTQQTRHGKTTKEMWDLRPAGDFPLCVYCDKFCKIVNNKFTLKCNTCE